MPEPKHYIQFLDESVGSLTAGRIKDAAGLSYRQLNAWDQKGVLPPGREEEGNWRRYQSREVFAIMVLAEMRERFGVSLDSLKWVREHMLRDGADYFQAAMDMVALLGVGVYVVTDLRRSFYLESDIELGNLMRAGAFGGDAPASYIFVKVNPIVNQLFAALDMDTRFEAHGRGYSLVRDPLGPSPETVLAKHGRSERWKPESEEE